MNTMITTSGSVVSLETWIAAVASSACIGCTSLVPWLFNMTFFERKNQATGRQGKFHVAQQRSISCAEFNDRNEAVPKRLVYNIELLGKQLASIDYQETVGIVLFCFG